MKRTLYLIWLVVLWLPAFGQKAETVEAEYTYYAPANVSLEEARRTALEQAMIKAIGDRFGYNVSQTNLTRIENSNAHSSSSFVSLGSSDVKGVWLKTIGEPEYDKPFYEQGMLVVRCWVKGKAREIVSSQIDFLARVLRNGVDDRYESEKFKVGDELYLSFLSPVSGYLTVYLADDDGQVQCLLPDERQQGGCFPVEANRRYLLFSREKGATVESVFQLECRRSVEHNQLYVIFSPHRYVKAVDAASRRKAGKNKNVQGYPRELSYRDFHKWLSRCRMADADMVSRTIVVTIEE